MPNESLLLAIDAAPGVGSVALLRAGVLLDARAVAMRAPVTPGPDAPRARDDDPLARAVEHTLRAARVRPADLAGVACGAGPGGFTSLRIAAALAKGLAHATGRPLLAAPSLAWAAAVRAPAAGVWVVTLDALRGERYAARVEVGVPCGAGAIPAVLPAVRVVLSHEYLGVYAAAAIAALAEAHHAVGTLEVDGNATSPPIAAGAVSRAPVPADLASWEPSYGRLAEAQVRWEATHGSLDAAAAIATP